MKVTGYSSSGKRITFWDKEGKRFSVRNVTYEDVFAPMSALIALASVYIPTAIVMWQDMLTTATVFMVGLFGAFAVLVSPRRGVSGMFMLVFLGLIHMASTYGSGAAERFSLILLVVCLPVAVVMGVTMLRKGVWEPLVVTIIGFACITMVQAVKPAFLSGVVVPILLFFLGVNSLVFAFHLFMEARMREHFLDLLSD